MYLYIMCQYVFREKEKRRRSSSYVDFSITSIRQCCSLLGKKTESPFFLCHFCATYTTTLFFLSPSLSISAYYFRLTFTLSNTNSLRSSIELLCALSFSFNVIHLRWCLCFPYMCPLVTMH